MADSSQSLSQETIIKFGNNLDRASQDLLRASTSLEKCYSEECSDPQFIEFRNEIHDLALVFKDGLLPVSINIVSEMRYFLQKYNSRYDSWLRMLRRTIKQAQTHLSVVEILYVSYTCMATSFKEKRAHLRDLHASVESTLQKAQLAAKAWAKYADHIEEFICGGDVPLHSPEDEDLFSGTTYPLHPKLHGFPYSNSPWLHGPNKISDGDYFDMVGVWREASVDTQRMADISLESLRSIDRDLLPAVENFAETMQEIAIFFKVLCSDVSSFEKSGKECREVVVEDQEEDDYELRVKDHFDLMGRCATIVIDKCSNFLAMEPQFLSDLACIPEGDGDFVKVWLCQPPAVKAGLTMKWRSPQFSSFAKQILDGKESEEHVPGFENPSALTTFRKFLGI